MCRSISLSLLLLVFACIAAARGRLHGHQHPGPLLVPALYSTLGNDQDVWFVNITVGSPPQFLTVQVDTGSSDLLIYAKSCSDCKTEHSFDHKASTTFQHVSCDDELCGGSHRDKLCTPCDKTSKYCLVTDSYVDGSFVAGTVATDKVSFLGLENTWSFGLVTNESKGFLPHKFSGIWGFAFAPESCWWQDSAIFALLKNSSLPQSISICLMEENAFLVLGEDFNTTTVDYGWTPLFQENFWAFTMSAISYGNATLNLSNHALNEFGSCFDTGWQGFGLNDETHSVLMDEITKLCKTMDIPFLCNGTILHHHVPLSPEQLALYPTLAFTMTGGLHIPMTPDMYLTMSNNPKQQGWYKWDLSKSGKGVGTTFGSDLLKHYRLALDVTGQRIGIAPASTYCQPPYN